MDTRVSTDIRSIADENMSSERGRIRHDYSITNQAIMRDVCLRHDQAIISDPGEHSTACRAAMNRDKLPDLISSSNSGFGRLTFVFQVLRSQTNRDKGKDVSLGADGGTAVNYTVRFKADSIFDFHVIANDAVRTNETAVTNPRA